MINFIIPGIYEQFLLNKNFILFKNDHPEYFYDNVNIDSVYGSFPYNIWDGGRVFERYNQISIEEVQRTKEFYDKHNIKMRLICTNPVLEEKDLTDIFMNRVCELFKNDGEIVINSSLLEEYIKINFPNIKLISSTTKCIKNFEQLNQEIDNPNYKMVCLDYNLNKQFNNLKQIKHKEKCEFLCNAICPSGCPNRKRHYELNGLSILNHGLEYNLNCGICSNTLDPIATNYPNNIYIDDIINIYEPMGFEYFKLEGRTIPPLELLGNYIKYFIKPEYQIYSYHYLS